MLTVENIRAMLLKLLILILRESGSPRTILGVGGEIRQFQRFKGLNS